MDWDEVAGGWDEQPGAREYAGAAFRSLQRIARARRFDLAGATACDFGCGTGLLTERLVSSCRSIDAVDTSPRMLEVLDRKRAERSWDNVGVRQTVPDEADYDLVVCSSVLAFVDDHAATVGTLVDRLAPNGLFVQWDWELDESESDGFGLSRDAIERVLVGAGLVDVTVDTAFEISLGGETMAPLVGCGRR